MDPKDLTLEVLKDIRQELRETRTELLETRSEMKIEISGLKEEIRETNVRVDILSDRVVESELRVTTAVTDLHGTVRELTDVLRSQHDLRPRVERCERDISDIQRRLSLGRKEPS
jgi:chromosome segregation ATPase